MKFSIITPAKQIDDFTKMAIDSVQSQTIRSLFEHIIIIDDQNSNLPENHKYENYSIKYLRSKRTMGPSSSRNEGISIAKGEIICFLDSDDLWTKNYLQELEKIFDSKKEVDAVSVGGYKFGDNSSNGLITTWQKEGLLSRNAISWNAIGCPSGFSFRYSLKKLAIFEENLRWCEDYLFYLNLMKKPDLQIYRSNDLNYWYRISNTQVTHQPKRSMLENSRKVFAEIFKQNIRNSINFKYSINVYLQSKRSFNKAIGKIVLPYTILLTIISPGWFIGTMVKILKTKRQ